MFLEEECKKAKDQTDGGVEEWVEESTSPDPGVSPAKEQPAVQEQKVIEFFFFFKLLNRLK